MISFIDLDNDLSIGQAEHRYISTFLTENEDPAKRHRVPIRCWDEATGSYRAAWFYEPSHEVLQLVLSELGPIWTRTQVSPACVCAGRYYSALAGKAIVESSTTTYQLPLQAWQTLNEAGVPKAVLKKLKALRGQVYFSQQEASDALVSILRGVLTKAQIEQHGDVIMASMIRTGDDPDARQRRLAELQAILDEFYGAVPQKPAIPTDAPCPFCHLPHRYTFWELLPYEQTALTRIMHALVGAPVMLRDVPKVIEALELWMFAADAELFSKKKAGQTPTMTGIVLSNLAAALRELRKSLLGSDDGTPPAATASSSSIADSPPPSIPDDLPADK